VPLRLRLALYGTAVVALTLVLFGVLLSVLPLLLVIAAIAGGVYLIVH